MNYDVIAQFLGKKANGLVPVAVDVLTAGDYHLYLLFNQTDAFYVLIETDHPDSDEHVIRDISFSFPVTFERWCKEQDSEVGSTKSIFLCVGNRYYALAKVQLKSSTDITSFGLSYYKD